MQILWPAGSHCHRSQGSQYPTGKALCSWDPQDDNGIIVVKQHSVIVGKHTVFEHSHCWRPRLGELLISANALVATSTECDYIVLPCTIASKETKFNTFAMADCGATASFIDSLFAHLHGLNFFSLQHPRDLTVADGRIVSSGSITHTVSVQISFTLEAHTKIHTEVLELFVTTLGQYPVMLGLPWLQKHDLRICFRENTITFNSKHCLDHCIATHQAMTIRGADNTFNTLHAKTPQTPQETHEIHKTTPKTHETRRSTPKPQYSPRSSHQIDMADCTRKMNRELTLLDNPIVTEPIVTEYAGAARQPTKFTATSATSRPLDISMISAAPFNHLVQQS